LIAELLSNRALSAFLASAIAAVCLVMGAWMSLRPAYWASLGSALVPESMRAERAAPNPFAPARPWRVAGQVVVSAGLAFAGVALWLMLSMTAPV
jgi:uncharacterized membrane protein YdfJ with MMPL/SSD domain